MSPNSGGIQGTLFPDDAASQFNAHSYVIWSILSKIATTMLVQVKAVTNAGGVEPVGFVDIQPMVNQLGGSGISVPHGTIFHCPYFRLQGGENAVILDPQVGDIGFAVFASRDISAVVASRGLANPGSGRQYDWSDGLYVGGLLNGTPTQYVRWASDGIYVVSPTKISLMAPDIEINASATLNLTAPALRAHSTISYKWDVKGYGESVAFDGTSTWTVIQYITPSAGQTVNSSTVNIDEPEIP